MPTIHIHRPHHLGLAGARQVAIAWAEKVEAKYDMACTIIEGDDADTVEFTRSGVQGTLQVSAEDFELQAQLGLLLGVFAGTIEAEIVKELDAALAHAPAGKHKPARSTARPSAKAAHAPSKAGKAAPAKTAKKK